MLKVAQIKKDWKKRGFSFGVWEDSPGQAWKDYAHDTDELFMLAEGEVSVTLNGKTIEAVVSQTVSFSSRTSIFVLPDSVW